MTPVTPDPSTTSEAGRSYHHGDLPNSLRAAAVELIEERGPAGFSLREVARRAGVSHAAPAHHFGDTAGLLTSIAVEAFEHLRLAFVAAADGVEDPAERLVRQSRAYVETAQRHPAHIAVVFRSDLVHTDDPAYQDAGLRSYTELRTTIELVRDRYNPALPVETAAQLCWSSAQGLVDLYDKMVHASEIGTMGAPGDIGERAEIFARLLLAGLIARPPGSAATTPD